MIQEPTKLTQYRMTIKNHQRIAAAAAEDGVTIIEWMAAHFDLYFGEVDAILAKRHTRTQPGAGAVTHPQTAERTPGAQSTPRPSRVTAPPRKRQGARSTVQR